MTDDEAFIRAIVDAPGDDAPRLIYADWLDERGDPRGAYLRAEATVFRLAPDTKTRTLALEELEDSAESIDRIWAARVSRPPVGVCCDHIQFVESGPPLDEIDLRLLQSRLGTALPTQYAAFLLNYNGGYPRSRKYRLDIDFLSAEGCDSVRGFCRVGVQRADLPSVALYAVADDDAPAGDDPADFIAVATSDQRNELIFIGFLGARSGRVYRSPEYDYENNEQSSLVEWYPSLGLMLASLRIRRAGIEGYAPVT